MSCRRVSRRVASEMRIVGQSKEIIEGIARGLCRVSHRKQVTVRWKCIAMSFEHSCRPVASAVIWNCGDVGKWWSLTPPHTGALTCNSCFPVVQTSFPTTQDIHLPLHICPVVCRACTSSVDGTLSPHPLTYLISPLSHHVLLMLQYTQSNM
jgi:hypothetical protein